MGELEDGLQKMLYEDFPLYRYMGLKVECASEGIYRCRVPLANETSNHFKTVHAALQWATAEVLGGLVWYAHRANSGGFVPVVRSFQIDFKRPAHSDVIVEASFGADDAELMSVALEADGRYDFELNSVLRNTDGETIGIAKGTYAIRLPHVLGRRA